MSRANYIFVDFENVQERELGRIEGKPVKVVFGKTLTPEEVEDTVKKLVTGKVLSLSAKGEVAYKM